MRLLIAALLVAISYAQTGTTGNCEANTDPAICNASTGDDGFPCMWHVGDNGCKENTEGVVTPVAQVEGEGTGPVTPIVVSTEIDGCEEFGQEVCSSNTGENGEACHWVIAEGCKAADCEHFRTSETCAGQTGEHGRACQWVDVDEGCEETPGVDLDGEPTTDSDGCEVYDATTCSSQTGENGVACHLYQNECKESNCEHYLTPEDCARATSEDNETCAWNLGDGCKEATDPTEASCNYFGQTECATSTGENGKTCYWDQTANGGLGKCDEAEEVEAAELPGLLRSTHQTKQTSSPSVWMYVGVFLGTFFITAGVTFGVLRKCSNAPTEDINMSYRAVV